MTFFQIRRFKSCIAIAMLLGISACSPKSQLSAASIDLTGQGYGEDFRLSGTDGNVHTMVDFRGKVVMLFFGFTQCPDVCPTALVRAAEVRQKLQEDADKLQVIFVTLDPERDTPAILKSYTSAFSPSFLGLATDLENTKKTAASFKVFYQKVPTGSSYTMDHSAITYLLDPSGKMRVGIRPAVSADDIVKDVRYLLNKTS
jgi:protein SCO1/2